VTPSLNVLDIVERFSWFEKLSKRIGQSEKITGRGCDWRLTHA
jgi:hypothetical protein